MGHFIMSLLILFFSFYIIYPVILIFIQSFNVAGHIVGTYEFSFANWIAAFKEPDVLESLYNTVLVFVCYTSISFPLAVIIAWVLARTPIPFSRSLEFMFWVSFMLPALTTTIGWSLLLDPYFGFINVWAKNLFSLKGPMFDIYSVEGIVFALFPEGLKRKLIAALEMPSSTLRAFGLVAAVAGLTVVWMVRG